MKEKDYSDSEYEESEYEIDPEVEKKKKENIKEHSTKLDKMAGLVRDPFANLRRIYGRNGKLPVEVALKKDYDRVVIPKSKTLDENMITAIVLGAAFNPVRLDRAMTGSSFMAGSSTYIDFNRTFLLENMKADEKDRMGYFPETLVQAKKEAAEAIKDFEKGRPKKATEYVQRFIEYCAGVAKSAMPYTSSALLSDSEWNNNKAAIRMAANLLEKEPFNHTIKIPEYDRMRLMAYGRQAEIRDTIYTRKINLMKKPSKAGSKAREEEVAELMLAEYAAGGIADGAKEKERLKQSLATEILEKYGVDPGSPEFSAIYSDPNALAGIIYKLNTNVDENRTSDLEVILSKPDGLKMLRDFYLDDIKKTSTYKKLVNASGDDLKEQLTEMEKTTSKGFSSLKKAKIKGEADHFNKMNADAYNKGIQKVDLMVREYLEVYARGKNRITAYDKNELDKNAKRVTEYQENLRKVVKKDADVKLLEIDNGLEQLRKQAENMAKDGKASKETLKEYADTIDSIRKSISDYQKGFSSSLTDEDRPVIYTLRRLNRNLEWNKKGILEPQKQEEREITLQTHGKGIYRLPTENQINALQQRQKEILEADKLGMPDKGKEIIEKSIRASEKLGEIIKNGYKEEDRKEAAGYLHDIMTERVYRKIMSRPEKKHETERYAPMIVDEIPEFHNYLMNLNADSLGKMAFEDAADRILDQYDNKRLDNLYLRVVQKEGKSISDRMKGKINREIIIGLDEVSEVHGKGKIIEEDSRKAAKNVTKKAAPMTKSIIEIPDDDNSFDEIKEKNSPAKKKNENRKPEPDDREKAKAFIRNVHILNTTKKVLAQALAEDYDRLSQRRLSYSELDTVRHMDYCRQLLNSNNELKINEGRKSNKVFSRDVLSNLSDLSIMMKHMKGESGVRTQVILSVFTEAIRPLVRLDKAYPPLNSVNGLEENWENLNAAAEEAEEKYKIESPSKQQLNQAYRELEDRAKARMIFKKDLEKACGKPILTNIGDTDPQNALFEMRLPKNMHEFAKNCVAMYFIDTAEAPDANVQVLRGLSTVIRNNGYKGQVAELEKNPVFQSVARRYPESYYTKWKKIMERSDVVKAAATDDLRKMNNHEDVNGLAGYVVHGENGPLDLLAHIETPQKRNVRNARFARVLTNQILADPAFNVLRNAVAAKRISKEEIMIEAMAYAEKKNIRYLNRDGEIDQSFRQKMNSGAFKKELLSNQTKFLKQMKGRKDTEKQQFLSKMQSENKKTVQKENRKSFGPIL